MTLLTICNQLAQNVGLATTDQVITSPRREWAEAVVMSNAVGDELARRVDFGALNISVTLTGNGADREYDLGVSFSRLIPGIAVTYGTTVIRPLAQAEWASLVPVVGIPRYFNLKGRKLRLWPYLAADLTGRARYQSRYWCLNGTAAAWKADTDTSVIDEQLMIKGLIVRWRRQKGMAYEDYEAEYESDLADLAEFDDRARF